MTKYTRITGKVFGSSADPTGSVDPTIGATIGQFGSALAGTYNGTADIATIQGLPAWQDGFIGAVTPNTQFPPLPEMTGFGKVLSYQLCYLLQQGVAEYDSGTTYYEGNWVSYNKELYVAKQDNFSNQLPTNTTYWTKFTGGSSRNLGEYVTSSLPSTDTTLHLADGSLLSQTYYPELLSYINNIYSTTKDWITPVDKLTQNNWSSIAYGNNKYVAISESGYVATSSDADTWSTPTWAISGTTQVSIIYDGAKFIALDEYGSLSSSTDGNTWNMDANLGNNDWKAIIYANNLYIAIGNTGYITILLNGTWSIPSQILSSHSWRALAYDGTKYLALGLHGHISTSTDGSTWTTPTTPTNLYNTNYKWASLVYDGTQFIALDETGISCTSTNGTTWNTPQTTILNNTSTSWKSLINTTNGLVALSNSGYIGIQADTPVAPFTTEADWQTEYSTYGECGKYVYNSGANTVRIPAVNSYFTNTTSPNVLGNLTPASLPNIKGAGILNDDVSFCSGALYDSGSVSTTNSEPGGSSSKLVKFDANKSNSIYKDSATTVNTQSIKQLVYIVVKQ